MARPKKFKNIQEYRKWYANENRERIRQRQREWARKWRKENPELARKKDKENRLKSVDRRRKYQREYSKSRPKDPVKVAARTILNNALQTGKLVKANVCEVCLEDKPLQGHHEDYLKPLEVKWLCIKCHALEHHPLPSTPSSNILLA